MRRAAATAEPNGHAEFTVEHLDPRSLAANPKNWREHPERQDAALRESIREHGWLAAPIFNRRTGFLIDGHLRVAEAIRQDAPSIPVRVVDVSADQEARILASFDRIGELRGQDDVALAALLRELADSDAGLPAAWNEDELGDLLLKLGAGDVPDFHPVGEDEQGRLDEKARVTCPECGHAFAP